MTSSPTSRRSLGAVALGSASVVLLTACGGGGTDRGAGSGAFAPSEPSTPVAQARTSWTSDLTVSGDPVVVGETLVVATGHTSDSSPTGRGLAAIDAATGETVWSRPLPVPEGTDEVGPNGFTLGTVDGDPVVVASYTASWPASGLQEGGEGPRAAGFDADTGELLWEIEAPGQVMYDAMSGDLGPIVTGEPAPEDIAVFVPEANDDDSPRATGVDLATGEVVWTYTGTGKPRWHSSGVLVAEDQDSYEAWLTGIDRATGREIWRSPGAGEREDVWWQVLDVRGGSILGVRSTSTVGSGSVYEAALIDLATGTVLGGPTTVVGHSISDAAVSDDGARGYVVDPGRQLTALGGDAWVVPLPSVVGGQLVRGFDDDGNLVVVSAGLVVLDRETGEQIGGVQPDSGDPTDRPAELLTGELVATVGDWYVYLDQATDELGAERGEA